MHGVTVRREGPQRVRKCETIVHRMTTMAKLHKSARLKTSSVWAHFVLLNEDAVTCLYCKKTLKYSGSTSTMHYHLKGQHAALIGQSEDQKPHKPHKAPKAQENNVASEQSGKPHKASKARENNVASEQSGKPHKASKAQENNVASDQSCKRRKASKAQKSNVASSQVLEEQVDSNLRLQLTVERLQKRLDMKERELTEAYKVFHERVQTLREDMRSIQEELSQHTEKHQCAKRRPQTAKPAETNSQDPQTSTTTLTKTSSVSDNEECDDEPLLTLTCISEPTSPSNDYTLRSPIDQEISVVGNDYTVTSPSDQKISIIGLLTPHSTAAAHVDKVLVTGRSPEQLLLRTLSVRLEDCKHKLGPNGVYFVKEKENTQTHQSVRILRTRLTGEKKQGGQEEDSDDDGDWDDPGYSPESDPSYIPEEDPTDSPKDNSDRTHSSKSQAPQSTESDPRYNHEENPAASPKGDSNRTHNPKSQVPQSTLVDGDCIASREDMENNMGEVYVCNLCDDRFTKKYYIKLHRLLHDKEATLRQCLTEPLKDVSVFKLYQCRMCGRRQNLGELNSNQPRHSRESKVCEEDAEGYALFTCGMCRARAPENSPEANGHNSPEANEHHNPEANGHDGTKANRHDGTEANGHNSTEANAHHSAEDEGVIDDDRDDDHDDDDGAESQAPQSPHAVRDYVPPREDVENDSEEVYVCYLCNDRFTKKYYMKLHRLIHDENATLEQCLTEPMRYARTVQPCQCDVCGRRLKNQAALQLHLRVHMQAAPRQELDERGRKMYKCDACDRMFKNVGDYHDHYRGVHLGQRPYVCPWCEKSYVYRYGLRTHQKWHCKKRLPQTQMHTRPQHACTQCPKTFLHRYSLKLHELSHSEDRSFKCFQCDKRFKTRQCRRAHLKTHNAARQFLCDTCGKGFLLLAHLKRHSLTHTGEKPYSCPVCNKQFSLLQALKEHSIKHSGLFPFRCTVCDKGFARSEFLEKHKRVHTKEKPYHCSICKKNFGYAESLYCHNKRFHSCSKDRT
ncbi:hypothetical protein ACEWY4_017727 [Coilia grayii]|uniref:Uncharacterized protein n=1 Tax=Coilia grayii TaxID=363190 RepID=A0ABD1JHQ5_9TELE